MTQQDYPPDFRALCQELMDAIDSGIPGAQIKQSPLAVRVDAALAQSKPQGPTLDDISELCEEFEFHLDSNGEYSDTLESAEALWEICHAVLARWGK